MGGMEGMEGDGNSQSVRIVLLGGHFQHHADDDESLFLISPLVHPLLWRAAPGFSCFEAHFTCPSDRGHRQPVQPYLPT